MKQTSHAFGKTRFGAIISIIALSLATAILIMFMRGSEAYAEETSDVKAAAQDLITSVLADNNYRSDFDFDVNPEDTISLGEEINVSLDTGNGFYSAPLLIWPVYSNSKVIASIIETKDKKIGSSYRFTTANSSEIDSFVQANEDCSFIISANEAKIASSKGASITLDDIIDAKSYTEEFYRTSKPNIMYDTPHFSRQTDEQTVIKQQTSTYLETPRWRTWVTISVPRVKQESSITCWAACASCVGFYLTNRHISDIEISHKIHGTEHTGSAQDTIRALSFFRYDRSTLRVHAAPLSHAISQHQVENWINNGMPIIARLNVRNQSIGHQVVVCGYTGAFSHSLIKIMNPGNAHFEVLTRHDDDAAIGKDHGYTWDRGTIVLNGWNRSPGSDKFDYFLFDGTIKETALRP